MQKITGQFEGLFEELFEEAWTIEKDHKHLMDRATARTGRIMIKNGSNRVIRYNLAHRTIGEARISFDICIRCFKERKCLMMGEDEYGYGYLCKDCIDWLFNR
jgi:hypothetical protein